MPAPLLLTAAELRQIMIGRYPWAYPQVMDRDYNVPTPASIDVFDKELATLLFQQFGDKWQKYYQCENFAFTALELAQRKHWVARQAGSGSAEGIAFGLLCFSVIPVDLTTGHAINIWVDADKVIHELEPQTRLDLNLTPLQCRSASFYLFL